MTELPFVDTAARIGLAVACGAAIGLDRESKSRPAGLRTMILVALGAAVFVMAGESLVLEADKAIRAEAISRVLQGLVGGIGFLGAATVFRDRLGAQGVTTAATVWVVAAIGAAGGLGLYATAVASTVVTVLTLTLIKRLEKLLPGGTRDTATGPGTRAEEGEDHAGAPKAEEYKTEGE